MASFSLAQELLVFITPLTFISFRFKAVIFLKLKSVYTTLNISTYAKDVM